MHVHVYVCQPESKPWWKHGREDFRNKVLWLQDAPNVPVALNTWKQAAAEN